MFIKRSRSFVGIVAAAVVIVSLGRDFVVRMLQLHFYSNHTGRLVLRPGQNPNPDLEIYPLESIKEFEHVSQAWKRCLAGILRKSVQNSKFLERNKQKKMYLCKLKIFREGKFYKKKPSNQRSKIK